MRKRYFWPGDIVNNLVLVRRVREPGAGRAMWLCRCKCGREKIIAVYRSNNIKSCGCLVRAKRGNPSKTHRLHYIWRQMKRWCSNRSKYPQYKGLFVCKKWAKFKGFVADMDESYIIGASLTLIDKDKDFRPSNCKWTLHSNRSERQKS